ncbi:alcohol acetyltransferase [Cytidiella melzeri]|nr:alcohol acetyltransferase [Cytidiella melzeri]
MLASWNHTTLHDATAGDELSKPTVLHALKRVILALPALCIQIAGDYATGPFYLVRLLFVNLSDVLEYHKYPCKTLQDVYTMELHTSLPRDVEKPLWRVIVHDNNTVVFAWSHSIGDGQSGHALHHALVSALNHEDVSKAPEESFIVDVPLELTLLPTTEERTNTAVSWKTFFQALYNTFTPASWQRVYAAWTASPVISVNDISNEVRLRKLPAEHAKRLVNLCRQNGCTLTSFLHTLALCVLSHLIKTYEDRIYNNLQKYKTFSTVVLVSLRRFTGTSALDICDQVSGYHSFPPIIRDVQYPLTKATFPWKMAADFKTSLQSGLEDTRQVVGTIKYMYSLGIAAKYFANQLGKKRGKTFELSNTGVMPKVSDGRWQIDEVCFGQNNAVCGQINVNVAGSPSGTVSFSYTWGTGMVDKPFMEEFVAQMHFAMASALEA